MNTNQILTALGVVVAIAAVFVGQVAAYSALILVALGLVSGFMSPMADAASRMAYTVAAVAMPTLANSLDVIPAVGAPINAIIDNIAIMIAGMVVANFLLAVALTLRRWVPCESRRLKDWVEWELIRKQAQC